MMENLDFVLSIKKSALNCMSVYPQFALCSEYFSANQQLSYCKKDKNDVYQFKSQRDLLMF